MNERSSLCVCVLDARGECKRFSFCRSSMLFLPFELLLYTLTYALADTQALARTHHSFISRSFVRLLFAHLSSRFSWQTVWRIGCCIDAVLLLLFTFPSSSFSFDFSVLISGFEVALTVLTERMLQFFFFLFHFMFHCWRYLFLSRSRTHSFTMSDYVMPNAQCIQHSSQCAAVFKGAHFITCSVLFWTLHRRQCMAKAKVYFYF